MGIVLISIYICQGGGCIPANGKHADDSGEKIIRGSPGFRGYHLYRGPGQGYTLWITVNILAYSSGFAVSNIVGSVLKPRWL